MNSLFTWLGKTDVENMREGNVAAIATIALKHPEPFDKVIILANAYEVHWEKYKSWLQSKLEMAGRPCKEVQIVPVHIQSPIDYASIHVEAEKWINKLSKESSKLCISLTSGTPAMISLSILIGKGKSNTTFLQTSPQNELIPTEIPVDFVKEYKHSAQKNQAAKAVAKPNLKQSFANLTSESKEMKEVVALAEKLSQTEVPILILGETGTGKEVMAQAIQSAGLRKNKSFIIVNCGALPETIVDSILFGHVKGAFTGAVSDKRGLFEQADGGTIFLDEVGELTPEIQVKLLRILQQGEVTRVGDDNTISVDVRVIAATHRNLVKMMDAGEFREDLFYRLAVGIIRIPPLRARRMDLPNILKELTASINQTGSLNPDYKPKQLSDEAIDYISKLPWKGNIRELWNTLNRLFITTNQKIIEAGDIANSIIKRDDATATLDVALDYGQTINVEKMVDNYRKKYVLAALSACGNNYTKAARMLGLKSHQRLKDWMSKLDIEIDK